MIKWLIKQYNDNINGIIFTLIFHIVVFIILNISHFNIKNDYVDSEIIIDFPLLEPKIEKVNTEMDNESDLNQSSIQQTNFASNRSQSNAKSKANAELEEEIKKANQLVKDVNKQLSKDIPTIGDLKMPVETTVGMNPDSVMKKLYTGDSNVEYFLENRYHVSLPIPVYLAQRGGIVKVNIVVDSNGKVIKAEPEIGSNASDQMLSYAKTAAIRTRFNSIAPNNQIQTGYIKYKFIAQ